MKKLSAKDLLLRKDELAALANKLQEIISIEPFDREKFTETGIELQRWCHQFGQAVDIVVKDGRLVFVLRTLRYPQSN